MSKKIMHCAWKRFYQAQVKFIMPTHIKVGVTTRDMCCVKSRVEKNHDLKKNFFLKSGIHNVIKYFSIRLSGVNTATQVCALCAFVLKHTQNFVDLDACKQLFVLNHINQRLKNRK